MELQITPFSFRDISHIQTLKSVVVRVHCYTRAKIVYSKTIVFHFSFKTTGQKKLCLSPGVVAIVGGVSVKLRAY